jgi:anthranilate phosphoribosyltransferase
VLKNLGSECIWVVHGSDGLDEITTAGPTYVAALENGKLRTFEITPADFGIEPTKPESLRGGDAEHNAAALKDVLDNKPGAYREVAVTNAAAALVVAGAAKDLKDGVEIARKSLSGGGARARLEKLIKVSHG